ncbi:MAG: M16 family metallopeptidase [Cyclobacteriaceae bacterium]
MKKFIYLACTVLFTACATTTKMDSTQAQEDTAPVAEPMVSVSDGVLDRSKPPLPGPAPEIQLGTYESFTLENGMKVFVVENHKLPRVAFSLLLDVDPILEGDKAGYISTAGDLLSRGTTSRTKAELDEEVDFIGASLSSSAGGVFGSSLTKHQDKVLELMSDVLLNPSFPQSELDKIKKETISGLQANKEDANAIAQNVRGVLRYGKDHPYGELITEKTVANITLEDCKKYYHTYFKPNIAYMGIVGDINKAEAEVLVKKYFGEWKSGEVPKHNYLAPEAPAKTTVAMVDRPQSVQSVVNITYPIILKPGEPDVIKARVMNTILGGGFSSNWMQN